LSGERDWVLIAIELGSR